ncbi:MAG: hypothetical protein AAGC65_25530 [Mucilaginibacter sp.]|uniref:hypothetical protein n=1 Tax=Mucilaginibacter sp. TaxID=1882438 RepID=UPI0031AED4E3
MMHVFEKTGADLAGTAYCLATVYGEKGGYFAQKVLVFQTDEPDLDALKKAVDQFFEVELKTDLYVKEVPKDSALFEQEAARLYGTASVFCGSRAE